MQSTWNWFAIWWGFNFFHGDYHFPGVTYFMVFPFPLIYNACSSKDKIPNRKKSASIFFIASLNWIRLSWLPLFITTHTVTTPGWVNKSTPTILCCSLYLCILMYTYMLACTYILTYVYILTSINNSIYLFGLAWVFSTLQGPSSTALLGLHVEPRPCLA